jgi:hypothetical protein
LNFGFVLVDGPRFLPSYRKIMSFILDGQAETHRHYQEIIDQRQLNLSANQGRRLALVRPCPVTVSYFILMI